MKKVYVLYWVEDKEVQGVFASLEAAEKRRKEIFKELYVSGDFKEDFWIDEVDLVY